MHSYYFLLVQVQEFANWKEVLGECLLFKYLKCQKMLDVNIRI